MQRFARWKSFLSGLCTGIFLCVGLAAGFAYAVTERGVTAAIDVEAVAHEVRRAVELQVARMLPAVLDDLRQQVPARVAADLAQRLTTASFVVYGVEIQIPEETLRVVRQQVEETVTAELSRSFEQIDVAAAAEEWGQRGEEVVAEALRRELRSRTLLVRIHPELSWPAVPVILSVQP